MAEENKVPPIVPGVPLTQEQREKIATENAAASAEAVRQAAEATQRDIERGITPGAGGAISSVANMLKDKLVREDFSVAVDEHGNHIPARPHPTD